MLYNERQINDLLIKLYKVLYIIRSFWAPERILEHILPKKLTLVLRTWTTKDGEENQHYRMRVYIPSQRKYHYITLSSETYNDAKEESINRYLGMGKDIV